jgi:ABC-2 type transport system permease protein
LSSLNPTARAADEVRAVAASWRAKTVERFYTAGLGGYLLIWMVRPFFELGFVALIYGGGGRPDLIRYASVAIAAQSLVFTAIFYVGEILDRERENGTLVALFLAPCARASWLSGFALVGLAETVLMAAAALLFGRVALGVRLDPNLPAVLVTLALFVAALWGLGLVFSAIGLLLKKANAFSNVVFPFALLLGGVYYPVALLPDWLRYPARALPLGYGMQALADASLTHAGVAALAPQLVPLAGFALVLPAVGVLAFRRIERLVRERGELDLY